MDRDIFVRQGRPRWDQLERLLSRHSYQAADWSQLSSQYRQVCADLARAQGLDMSEDVLHYLDELAGRSHNRLYGGRRGAGKELARSLFVDFPRAVRSEWPFFVAANLAFYGPFFLGVLGPLVSPDFAALVLPESQQALMENMYSDSIGRDGFGQDTMMVGFYVMNNVGIAFRCFATGAFAGVGSVLALIYQGLILGTVEGHLWSVGLGRNLTEFTIGHTAWELTGIVIAGMAGMRMGWALVVTNGNSRASSLAAAGPIIYRLILGATVMLFMAAAIEGLWSASPAPFPLKIAFGILGLFVVVVWLFLGGRGGNR